MVLVENLRLDISLLSYFKVFPHSLRGLVNSTLVPVLYPVSIDKHLLVRAVVS